MNIQHDDFDPSKVVMWLVAHIEQPEKFAQIFCNAAKSQKIIDHHLKEIIKEILIKDAEMIYYLKEVVREVDKEDWRNLMKKIGFASWGLIAFISGVIFTDIVRHYFK